MTNETKWTKRWPRKVGYYWFYSNEELGEPVIVEVSGQGTARSYYTGDGRPKARSLLEQKYGYGCEWSGPIEPPTRPER